MKTSLEAQPWQLGALGSLWARLREACRAVKIQRRERRLHLCESLSLGEKRLLAIVECDQQRLLLAVTSENISLLQSLGPAGTQLERLGSRHE